MPARFLREIGQGDLPVLFEQQNDPAALEMAAFPARGREEFIAHWTNILSDEAVIKRAIVVGDRVAGYVTCWEQSGERLVGYWLGREYWGRGIATGALSELLLEVDFRPLHALVAEHNAGSIRVLEKCGFERSGEKAGRLADAGDVQELVFTLSR